MIKSKYLQNTVIEASEQDGTVMCISLLANYIL